MSLVPTNCPPLSTILRESHALSYKQSTLFSDSFSAAGEMQSLQEKASEWSGVAASDAFSIDETNVFNALGGDVKPFVELSTNFYNRVYDDEEEWFRSIFAGSRKEDAIRNQYEFFVQRMGGPPLYSQRRGLPSSKVLEELFFVEYEKGLRYLITLNFVMTKTSELKAQFKGNE